MRLGSHRKSTSIYNSAGAFSQYINFPEAGKVVLTIVDRARKAPVQSLGALDDSEWVRSYCIVPVYNFHGQWQYFQRWEGGGGDGGEGGGGGGWRLGRIPALLSPHPTPFTLLPPHCLIVLEMLVAFFLSSDSWSRSHCLGKPACQQMPRAGASKQ